MFQFRIISPRNLGYFKKQTFVFLIKARSENDATVDAVRFELESEVQKRDSDISDLKKQIDEIKSDYCELAEEKESLLYDKSQNKISEELNNIKQKDENEHKIVENLQNQMKNITKDFHIEIKKVLEKEKLVTVMKNQIENLNRQLEDSKIIKIKKDYPIHNADEQLKLKFSNEKEVWAKEKRRLESKVRHLSKTIGKFCDFKI